MPLYEYECKSCDATVEILVRSPDSKAECPGCGKTKLTRLMSATASPAVKSGSSLPVSRPNPESCGAPRCCGGGCDI